MLRRQSLPYTHITAGTESHERRTARMSSKEDLRNFQLQLDQVNDGLTVAPDDEELLTLKEELTDLITLLKEQLAAEQAEQAAKQQKWQQKKPVTSLTASPVPHSASDENNDTPEPAPETKNKQFFVGDVVSAKWASGDGGYYPAKITSATGSSAAPYYTVQFLKYDETYETLPHYHIRVLAEDKKRKVTQAGFDKPPPPKKIDPKVREAAEEKKLRRLREKQEMEKQQKSWQNFATKGPKKRSGTVGKSVPIGTNSMFKTPDGLEGRGNHAMKRMLMIVGVVGSGKGMTEHLGRVKHKFEKVKMLDED
jgi:survival of motor neuron-related-splicing factor 30